MSGLSDSDIIEFIKKFSIRNVKAMNKTEYVQKIITHLKQENPSFIKAEYNHLKRICSEQVDILMKEDKITFDRIRIRSPVTSTKLNKSPKRKISQKCFKSPPLPDYSEFMLTKNADDLTPTIKLSDLAIGSENLLLVTRVAAFLRNFKYLGSNTLAPCIGAIITGFPGSGKTVLVKAIAGEYKLPLVKKSAIDLLTDFKKTSEEKVKDLFEEVYKFESALLLIDDVDYIFSNPHDLSGSARMEEKRLVAKLCQCMDETSKSHPKIIVILTTSNVSIIDGSLRRPGRFEYEICISMPDEQLRCEILKIITRDFSLHESLDLRIIARQTPGYVAGDLVALVREALMISIENSVPPSCFDQDSIQNNKLQLSAENLLNAIKIVKPSSTREGFSTLVDVNWQDIGGLEEIKNHLKLSITGPIQYPKIFDSLGLHASTGILLVGPPGCGKTLVAKAVAHEDGLNFISVRGPELISSYVGESERAVRNLFSRAQIAEPCVIFFDEIDSLCSKRLEDGHNSHSSRLVNQLLTEMDGILKRNRVFIIGATNRPDIIDPAILRKGRFDRIFYIGLPSPAERFSILKTLTKNGKKPKLSEDVDLFEIANDTRCLSFSGADLASLIREASMLAFKNYCDNPCEHDDNLIVSKSHFDEALSKIKPSLSEKDLNHYEKLQHKFS